MNLSNKKINRLLAAQNLMEKGDSAVIEKILEFEDILEEMSDKLINNLDGIKDTVYQSLVEQLKGIALEQAVKKDDYIVNNISKLSGDIESVKGLLDSQISLLKTENRNKVKDIISPYVDKLSQLESDMNDNHGDMCERMDMCEEEIKTLKSSMEESDSEDDEDDSPEMLVAKIESIKTEKNKLSIDAVSELRNELENIKKDIKQLKSNGGQSIGLFGGRQLRIATFVFTGNDVTTAFTLPKEPSGKGYAIWAYYQGQYLQYGTHFRVSKKTFTCVGFTPQTGSYIEGFIII